MLWANSKPTTVDFKMITVHQAQTLLTSCFGSFSFLPCSQHEDFCSTARPTASTIWFEKARKIASVCSSPNLLRYVLPLIYLYLQIILALIASLPLV